MSRAPDRTGVLRRAATLMGLLRDGRPRTRRARILLVEEDSSAMEAIAGFSLFAVALALVVPVVLGGPAWMRPVALFTSLVSLVVLGQIVRSRVRRRRNQRGGSSAG